MDQIRQGRISSINYKEGKARVVYSDRDDCTTIELPFIVFNNCYHPPNVDDDCLVLHMPNGSVQGFILGDFWNDNHKPPDGAKQGLYRTEYSRTKGKAYSEYADPDDGDGNDGKHSYHNEDDTDVDVGGKLTVKGADQVKIESDGTVELSGASMEIKSDGTLKITGGNVQISGSTVIDGIQFSTHTHNCTAPGFPSGPPV